MAKPLRSIEQIMDEARDRAGWNDRTTVRVLMDFIFTRGRQTVSDFDEYVMDRVAEDEAGRT